MSKKGKNSNYKNNTANEEVMTEKTIPKEKVKLIAIISAAAVAFIALIALIIGLATPKGEFVELDFGEYGKVVVQLDRDEAPETVKNFLNLVNDKFYDGLTIFRAQNNFVIQGGKNDKVSLNPIVGEFSSNGHTNNISHTRGVISMARTSNPDSATSQFFITLSDSAARSLDGSYAAFGYVVEGMDVVDKIAETLMSKPSDYMGFVSDSDAITIVSARVVDR